MHSIRVFLLLVLVAVVSTVAFYKACRKPPDIDPDKEAIVAKAISGDDSSKPAEAITQSLPQGNENSGLRVVTPSNNSNRSYATYIRSTARIMLRANSEFQERSFDALVHNPAFTIEMDSSAAFRVGAARLPAGEYDLRLANAADTWTLLFYPRRILSPVATLPLTVLQLDSDQKWELNVNENKRGATITLSLGVKRLEGTLEFQANEMMAEVPTSTPNPKANMKAYKAAHK